MQLIIATIAFAATAAGFNFNSTCKTDKPLAKVVNRCSYPVYLWSIDKEMGCPSDAGVKLNTGDFYHENFRLGSQGGISVKLSKTETCGGKDITQLEYKIQENGEYQGNYLDMSFVDCTENLEDCPGRTDGYYLKSGNDNGKFLAAVNNEHCPIFNVYNAEEAAKVAYINWDDRQTKYCDQKANLELYLCGGDAPSADDAAPVPASSETPSSTEVASIPSPSSYKQESKPAAPSTTEEAVAVAAAAITEAPAGPIIKTEVVYVTEFVKRHAHGRRHQHFHA